MTNHSSPVTVEPEYPDAPLVCAELYQVIGYMAFHYGIMEHPDIQKALDNASQHKLVHADLLPWPKQDLPSALAQTPTSDVQHGADYLFDELEKLGAHVTYTACKALVTKLYALGIPAQRQPMAVEATEKLATVLTCSVHRVVTEVDHSVVCPDNERVLYAVQLTQSDIDLIIAALRRPAQSTRNAVIEECAKVADSVGEWLAARKIRDLLSTVPSTDREAV